MGPEAVPRTAVCAGGDGRCPEYSGKHQPGTGSAVHHPAFQLPVPNRMYVLGVKAAGRGILLSLLVKVHAEAELLPEKRGAVTHGACGKRESTPESAGSCQGH